MTEADLYGFLSPYRLAVLSTLAAALSPQSALVGIAVTPSLEIIFDTVDISRKYTNLQQNARCSFVIGWEGERTVQYEGLAYQITGTSEFRNYFESYCQVWPDAPARQGWKGLVYFIVRPSWIRYSDYDARPPRIEELRFSKRAEQLAE